MLARMARRMVRSGGALAVRVAFPSSARIQTHLTAAEKLTLFGLALRSPGRVYVEIGSYLGASACFIAAGARLRWRGRARLFCIDTWENLGMTEGHRDTWQEFRANTAAYASLIRPLRGNSTEVGLTFDQPVDFLFVDGGHDYASVRGDVDAWLPKVRPGGIVAFHDWGWAEGVRRVVEEQVLPRSRRGGALPNLRWAWI